MLKRVSVPILVLCIAAVLFVVIQGNWTSWGTRAGIQKTNDATVQSDQTPLNTRVSGTVTRVALGDYQPVKAGQLLVELDDADYQAAFKEAKAALEEAKAGNAANPYAKRGADAGIASARADVGKAQATVETAQAGIASAQASVTQADSEFKRQQALLISKAATRQQFEQAQASMKSAVAELQSRQADLTSAEAGTASARAALEAAKQQRASLDSKDAGLLAQIESKKAAITVAEVNLSYTKISAPADGSVGKFNVHPGQSVGTGTQVVTLVQSGVWIEANYRETQLARVRIGDAVDVRIDALPSQVFHGHVSEIAPASGSQFALLPPDNATGNYTKVVQRVPVKIVLDQNQPLDLLRPGFSAEVEIHASGAASDRQTARSSEEPLR